MTILFVMLNVKYANKSNWYWLGDKPICIPTMGLGGFYQMVETL